MAAKCKLVGEFDSISVATSAESATIHGIVASVSPMHPVKCTKFFEAKLTDRMKVMRCCRRRTGCATFKKQGRHCELGQIAPMGLTFCAREWQLLK